jgi:hypothetical protein
MRRVLDVARIQSMNWLAIFGMPLAVLGAVLLVNVVGFAVSSADATEPDSRSTGAILSIYLVMLIAHVQTITQAFPFAIGMSVTRRAFYSGTALLVTAQAVVFGIVLLVLGYIEQATGGWGVNVRMVALPFLVESNPFAQWLVYAVPFLTFSAVGVFAGVVFKRWGAIGVYVLGIGAVLVLGGLATLVTWQQWWPVVGSFFTQQSTFALLTVYPFVLAVVLGGAGWAAIRRATP